MQVKNLGEIKAVAFDIDGTLYNQGDLYLRMPFHFLRHSIFFLRYGIARKRLRAENNNSNFIKRQARMMGRMLHISEEEAQQKLDKIVYDGLKHYFDKITPCKYSFETIKAFKEKGLKIAMLSDFPPEQKGELWGMKPYCDVIIGTEVCGALKPADVPFLKMAELLGVKPEEILYVGNSYHYDVLGSKATGMKAAWYATKFQYIRKGKPKEPDIVFHDYRDLMKAVLG